MVDDTHNSRSSFVPVIVLGGIILLGIALLGILVRKSALDSQLASLRALPGSRAQDNPSLSPDPFQTCQAGKLTGTLEAQYDHRGTLTGFTCTIGGGDIAFTAGPDGVWKEGTVPSPWPAPVPPEVLAHPPTPLPTLPPDVSPE